MSHFARLENNIVQEVICSEQNHINSGMVGDSFNWVQTSYSGSFRDNYAGVGYLYDKTRNAFISPQPHPSYVLNESTLQWESSVPVPDGVFNHPEWDESTLSWKELI